LFAYANSTAWDILTPLLEACAAGQQDDAVEQVTKRLRVVKKIHKEKTRQRIKREKEGKRETDQRVPSATDAAQSLAESKWTLGI